MARLKNDQVVLRAAQALFLVNTAIWFVFGTVSLMRLTDDSGSPEAVLQAVAVLIFGNAVAMLLSAVLIGKQDRWGYLFAMAILVVNIFYTFTDQVGVFDWLTLALDVILLALLAVKWRVFLPVSRQA